MSAKKTSAWVVRNRSKPTSRILAQLGRRSGSVSGNNQRLHGSVKEMRLALMPLIVILVLRLSTGDAGNRHDLEICECKAKVE